MTQLSSGFTTTHAFTSVSPAAPACAATAGATPKGMLKPRASPPPAAAAEPTMNLRRERFGAFALTLFCTAPPLHKLHVLHRQTAYGFPRCREDRVHDRR